MTPATTRQRGVHRLEFSAGLTVAGKSWRVPPAPNGSAAIAERVPTFALPQALIAASVVVFSIAFGSQPLAALVSNFTSFLSNLMSALVAFGGIPAGLSASEVVVVTSTDVFLNFFLSNFGVA